MKKKWNRPQLIKVSVRRDTQVGGSSGPSETYAIENNLVVGPKTVGAERFSAYVNYICDPSFEPSAYERSGTAIIQALCS